MEKVKYSGGSFIFEHTESNMVIPEEMTDEQKMMKEMAKEFIDKEVTPHEEQLETLDYDLTIRLLKKAAQLGLLGVNIPEQFGGLGLDKVTSTYITEMICRTSSFSISLNTQTGIGSLPIVYFGNEKQKRKYLPDIASATKIGAYCLTEPSAGTDALGAKTIAKLSKDGKYYILNGSKIFITNGGIADIFIVYAKIDGEHFSAFIVEKEMDGFTIGPEEKKMGIKASSTKSLYFDNVHVLVENLLGEPGKGHLIAFNILNIGRHTLAINCLGSAKVVIEESAKYANERSQFGMPIAGFPLVGKKLAEMNILTYALETMVYRTAGLMDGMLKEIDHTISGSEMHAAKLIAEYAIECSINKVFASEALDVIADEGVQIHGGYGYTKEYKVERIYRDSRINRLFEGTNEINRVLIISTFVKRMLKGELPLLEKMKQNTNNIQNIQSELRTESILKREHVLEKIAKEIFYWICGRALEKYGKSLEQQQEVLVNLSDVLIQLYVINGVRIRTEKIIDKKGEEAAIHPIQMTKVFVHEAFEKVRTAAKEALLMMEEGKTLKEQLTFLNSLSNNNPVNTTVLKREIAKRVSEEEQYVI